MPVVAIDLDSPVAVLLTLVITSVFDGKENDEPSCSFSKAGNLFKISLSLAASSLGISTREAMLLRMSAEDDEAVIVGGELAFAGTVVGVDDEAVADDDVIDAGASAVLDFCFCWFC